MLTDQIAVQEPASPPLLPRFCNRCGRPREDGSAECAHCAQEATAESAVNPGAGVARDLQSIRSALFLYFALLGVSVSLIVWGMATEKRLSAGVELLGGALFSAIVVGAAIMTGLRQVAALLTARFHPGWLLFAIAVALPTYLLASGIVNFLYSCGVEKVEYVGVFLENGYGFGWAVAAICFQPAIFEEIAFRGIIQDSLGRVLGEREALVVTALMFGILHLSVPSLPHLLALGLVLGWLRLKTKSLLPGMVLHFAHNYLVIVAEQTGSIWPW